MSPELKQAIKLIKSGQKEAGKEILLQILNEDESNDTAWLWMSATVDTDELRLECLEEALRVNPNNEKAKRGYQKITRRIQEKEEKILEDVWQEEPNTFAQQESSAQSSTTSTTEWSYGEYQKFAEPELKEGGKSNTAVTNLHHNPLKSSPWITIWYAPRITVTAILQSKNPQEFVLIIAAIMGLLGGLAGIAPQAYLGREYLVIGFVVSLILGPIFGIIILYISGAVLSWLGFLLGGQGSSSDVRVALAWAWVPQIPIVLISVFQFALFGNTPLTVDPLTGMPTLSPAESMLSCLQLILSIWFFYIYLQCLGAAHRFSAWRAWATILLPGVVIGLFACMLIFLIGITG